MRSYQSHEARLKMREILTATEHGDHVQIKRYETPTATVVPYEWWLLATDAIAVINTALARGGFTTGDMEYFREVQDALGLSPAPSAESAEDVATRQMREWHGPDWKPGATASRDTEKENGR